MRQTGGIRHNNGTSIFAESPMSNWFLVPLVPLKTPEEREIRSGSAAVELGTMRIASLALIPGPTDKDARDCLKASNPFPPDSVRFAGAVQGEA